MYTFSTWDQVADSETTNSILKDLALSFAGAIADPSLRNQLTTYVRLEMYSELCKFELDYPSLTAGDAMNASQLLAFYRKRADLDIGVDKREIARQKFEASERLCRETNELFKMHAAGRFCFQPDVEHVLFRACRKIAATLGDVPELSQIRGRFGPGATTQLPKRTASARNKLSQTFSCSEDFVPLLIEALEELPGWVPFTEDSDSAIVDVVIDDGILCFVPKSALTDRTVVKEPMLNTFFQLGIGDYMSGLLQRRGIDLSDQTRNQYFAREGSITGSLATLDLSSASDTIARGLVAHLLPIDWFVLLDRLRTSTVLVEGRPVKLQKFSSMGNGFTFPLESLIFWAISSASIEVLELEDRRCSVYGDDIIVPTSSVELVVKSLTACGFSINMLKSYWSGPFRESCGKDYFSGIPIRPVFLKDRLSCESLFTMHNFFVRNGDTDSASHLLSFVDPSIRIFGPDGYGDGHLLGDCHYETPTYSGHRSAKGKPSHGWCGYIFETFTWKARKSFRALPGDYVYPRYVAYQREVSKTPFDSNAHDFVVRWGMARAREVFPLSVIEAYLESLHRDYSQGFSEHSKTGSFGVALPGTKGYKRISIYTLSL